MFRQHTVDSQGGELLCAPDELIIRSERDGHAHVVRLIGELHMSTAPTFDAELKRVEATHVGEIIVDLSGLTFIGSDGLKVLIHANARSRDGGNRLTLLRGTAEVQSTFETAGLLSRLPFAEDGARRTVEYRRPSTIHVVVSQPVRDWAA
jgi:anti-sigma B factor antagonist